MRPVYVVPHFHWDREWYQPHELFRWRLVQAIDEILDHMEAHPEYTCFNLDGQTIVIEDYLELRPENEGRLRRLIESGRIVIGPWLVQPDEFLPSGESHIRSFQRGIRFADRLGGSLRVGHCADQFGHISQMPQIMAGLGLTSACLWRGVPGSVPGWSFWWQAPDGTRLPVLYLRNSYSSGWRLPMDPEELLERTRRQEPARRPDEPLLLMNGTDHSRMEKHVPDALAAAGGRGYDFRLATLAGYEAAQLEAGIDDHIHHGELRSSDNSNVLVGVLSARMPIKQRDFAVSSFLERVAEPLELLSHLHGGPDGTPALRHAWRLLLENSPHDSICGCSVDQVHREMFPRYDRAEQLTHQVARESMSHLVSRTRVDTAGLAVFRPVPHAPTLLECDVPGDWDAPSLRLPGGAVVAASLGPIEPGEVRQRNETTPNGARRHLDFLREGRYDDQYIQSQEWRLEGRHLALETVVGQGLAVVDEDATRREVREVATSGAADTATVIVRRESTRRLRAVLPASPTIGLELLAPAADPVPTTVAATSRSIANEFYEVRFRNGRLVITDWENGITIENACLFVDEGDRGDEYNADILGDAVLSTSARGWHRAQVESTTTDAASATMVISVLMRVPAGMARSRKRRTRRDVLIPVQLTVSLHGGLPRVDFRATVFNTARDHRLRVLLPLPFATDHVFTENQFHVATRPLDPPPWNGTSAEQPPTTFPQKTWAAVEGDGLGLAVFNRGLPEGEVVRDAAGRQAYALTLLRAIGWLSRNDLATRRGGAGPMIATPDAQLPGTHTFDFALATYRGDWRTAGILPRAHAFAIPPLAFATNAHDGSLAASALPLATIEPAVAVPSALHRSEADGTPVLRLYSASDAPATTTIDVPAALGSATRADLLDAPTAPLAGDGPWQLNLRPWEIASLRLASPST